MERGNIAVVEGDASEQQDFNVASAVGGTALEVFTKIMEAPTTTEPRAAESGSPTGKPTSFTRDGKTESDTGYEVDNPD